MLVRSKKKFQKVLDKAICNSIIKGDMAAITISMETELLAEIERVARAQGKPISVFMQKAAKKYLDQLRKETALQKRKHQTGEGRPEKGVS